MTSKADPQRPIKAIKISGLLLSGLSLLLLVLLLAKMLSTREVVVNWNAARQTIDGFGASATGYTGTMTSAQADEFFSAEKGLGLSLLRIKVIAGKADGDCYCVSNSAPYHCVIGSDSQILTGDLRVVQLAEARGVKLIATPWSPPAEMKSSGKFCDKGAMIGTPSNYASYASEISSFPELLAANNVSLDAISVQNEPDIENTYDTCTWTPLQIHDFIPYLSSALRSSRFAGIKIAAPEESGWTFEKMKGAMDDRKVGADIGLILGHAYGVQNPASIPEGNGRHVWQSEVSGDGKYDGSMADAIRWATNINNYMNIGTNAWMYWNLDCGALQFNHDNNMCLTDQHQNLAKRAYALGQYAKFIRPGWQRVDVMNRGSLLVSAYKGPSRKFAIVVINQSRLTAWYQSFALNGITSQRSQVTPWLTSAAVSLAPQPPVSVGSNGTALTYSIPAKSIVTFEGQAD